MVESIKEIYANIYKTINFTLNNHIGSKMDQNTLKFIENNIIYSVKNYYPFIKLSLDLTFDQYSHSLNSNINVTSDYFPIMDFKNYHSHSWIDCDPEESSFYFYKEKTMKCRNCNMEITESGSPIDEDLSCEEWIIKNIIE